MSLPLNTARILKYLGHDLELIDVRDSSGVISITRWDDPIPQPTEAEIITAGGSVGFADWQDENGGNPTLTARRIVKEAVDTPSGKVVVALIHVLIDYGVIAATPTQVRDAVIAKIASGAVD